MQVVYFAQVPKAIALTCAPPRRTTVVRVDLGNANEMGPIKIGVTGSLPTRMRSLAARTEQPVTLLGALPGDRFAERRMHNMFSHLRLGLTGPAGTEWFRPAWELTCFITSLPSIDTAGIPYDTSNPHRDWLPTIPADPTVRRVTEGGRMLRAYLTANRISVPLFCEKHGMDRISVQRLLNGERWKRVGVTIAMNIERATGGAVPVQAWLSRTAIEVPLALIDTG